MRILHKEPSDGRIRLRAETLDDLWELSHIIQADDRISGRTERKVQMGSDRSNQVRKPMRLAIKVEQVELEHNILRVAGVIEEGPDDLISLGDHHSFSIAEGDEFELTKKWDSVTSARIERAAKAAPLNILLVVFDRENAYIAELTRRGYEVVQQLSGNVSKKAPGGGDENFWKTIAQAVEELDGRRSYSSIILASPAFWNDYLVKSMPQNVTSRIKTASVSAVGENAIHEAMRRPELQEVLAADRNSREELIVQEVLTALGTDKACYGIDECEEKVTLGQVRLLVCTQDLIETAREEEWFDRLDKVLEGAKQIQAEVHIIEHVTEQIDAIGGIAGALRW